MTHEQFIELYNKYQPWFNKPIELFTASNILGQRYYKKYLLVDIKGLMTKEEGGREVISTTSVVIQDLENFQFHTISLGAFDKGVRLINLGEATTLKLSNNNKVGHLTVENSLGFVEFFIIQINSHFGRTTADWSKIAGNLAINFISKRTSANPSSVPDKLYLASLIHNQVQPIFNLSKNYPVSQPNFSSGAEFYDTVEIVVEELNPINEDYELTFVFDKKP